MASPSMVQRSGDTLIVRSVVSGDRLFMDMSQEHQEAGVKHSSDGGHQASEYSSVSLPTIPLPVFPQAEEISPPPENGELPQCKIKRNYNCVHCNYFTQNPRHFLSHIRDVHDEKVKINDCPNCLYASRHFQKLIRHMKMVHGSAKGVDIPNGSKRKARESTPELDTMEEMDVDEGVEKVEIPEPKAVRGTLKCSLCPFTTTNSGQLTKHERKEHIKTKFFPCSKCNYVTHIKARFTKHVKYHSMPMIKCEVCDFRTPYKWNLDRHMKNHGGTGAFCCSVCNFTADIKQSLTVHEMNHHIPPAGQGAGGTGSTRRRNKVGGSDVLAAQASLAGGRLPEHDTSTGDSIQSEFTDMAMMTDNSDDRHSSSSKADAPDNSTSYGVDTNESPQNTDEYINYDMFCKDDASLKVNVQEDQNLKTQSKKIPRPIPNLIPLHLQTSNQQQKVSNLANGPLNLSTIQKNIASVEKNSEDSKISALNNYTSTTMSETLYNDDSNDQANCDNFSTRGSDESSQQSIQVSTQTIFKKKNASFFDKLKEKLLTTSAESGDLSCKDCGHLSKCLSEHSVHEKICSNSEAKFNPNNFAPVGSGSTRCQHCRHRCKSSLDLVIHMDSCPLAGKDRESPVELYKKDKIEMSIKPESEDEASVDDPQVPHPMENVVFVWNSMLHKSNSLTFDNSQTETPSDTLEERPFNKNLLTSTPNHHETTGTGKKVFKCPHCSFWASTASRFHVHIVGHLNKKPFECSLCSYRSNWRWDITKHIRLKSVRNPDHSKAKVLMTDETGRRNYSKYNRYLTLMQPAEPSADGKSGRKHNHDLEKSHFDLSDTNIENQTSQSNLFESSFVENSITRIPFTLPESSFNNEEDNSECKKIKKTMWRCKKCTYRNTSKEALLIHVRKHSKSINSFQEVQKEPKQDSMDNTASSADASGSLSYRCGHCYQVSNWKHVIQRHCRLKHNGDVRVIVGDKSCSEKIAIPKNISSNSIFDGKCTKCPFTSLNRNTYEVHVRKHTISADSIFKCFICSYYVSTEQELVLHLPLHGISEPEQYIANILSCKSSTSETGAALKRYKCVDCPYESNSKSQFMYHEQFHKPRDAPFKCDICNYQVSKRHLLHQHMKVHGIPSHKDFVETNVSEIEHNNVAEEPPDISFMWVTSKGEYNKMFKCPHCPFVKPDKQSVLDHTKMHRLREGTIGALKCPNCTFACNNMDVLLSHSEVHKEYYAKVLCEVNATNTDEEQISQLTDIMNKTNEHQNDDDVMDIEQVNDDEMYVEENFESKVEKKSSEKLLYFCPNCPARFLFEKELQIHNKFHNIRLPYQCQICSYTARQQSHLMAHNCVHSEEYQTKTKSFQAMHHTHPKYVQPKVVGMVSGLNVLEPVWIVVTENKKNETTENIDEPVDMVAVDDSLNSKQSAKHFICSQCPAKFFKNAALHYHTTLHGGNGAFKCKQCNYAVKTIGNLVKHEVVHDRSDTFTTQNDYESGDDMSYKNIPLSGTDLFQHKTEVEKRALSEKLITRPNDHFPPVLQADPQFGLLMHGNPDFIYPTYLKNGRQKEKRYKCHKCPSAFEKREQYKVHLSLHGSKQRYKCELCDYSVKYYANYVQHMRKHQMNADAHAARQNNNKSMETQDDVTGHKSIKLAIKTLPRHTAHKDSSKLSISDQQTLNLMHRRRSSAASNKEVNDERKNFRCSFCPYINQRRDALDNHMRRHTALSGTGGNFECPHCDYAAPQSQFLRDHLKIHFNTQKHLTPEYFTNFDGLEVYITKLDETENSNDKNCIFKSKNVEDCTTCKENVGAIMFVIPVTGERIEL